MTQEGNCPADGKGKRSEGNRDKMVSNLNHVCGVVNYRTLNLE